MDISMDIHVKYVDMDMDGKFYIFGKPEYRYIALLQGTVRFTSSHVLGMLHMPLVPSMP